MLLYLGEEVALLSNQLPTCRRNVFFSKARDTIIQRRVVHIPKEWSLKHLRENMKNLTVNKCGT